MRGSPSRPRRTRLPCLAVGPDSAIGVSRPQMDLIEDFIHDPPAGPVVRFETAGDGHEGHWGF